MKLHQNIGKKYPDLHFLVVHFVPDDLQFVVIQKTTVAITNIIGFFLSIF